jgi:Mg-chelatase subunit ChlD/predicted Ser/Thr protein kinase
MRLRGFFAPRALVPVLALLQCLVGTTSAQTSADLDAALNHKQDAVEQLKLSLETAARDINAGTFDNSTCEIYSSCSAELKDPYCHFNYGNSKGCGCDKGRTIDTKNSVIKTSPKLGANDYSVKRTACQAKYVDSTLRGLYDSMIEKGDAKWLFYGSKDGVLINFPGIVWDAKVDDNQCGASYDARIRPWHMTAATGPKNIILILDSSGSMQTNDRISLLKKAAKSVLDATTFTDFVGVIEFNSYAENYAGLTTLARAMPEFKDDLKCFIDGFFPGGGTNMISGFERAFQLVDDSREKSYDAGCHTTYVLVTDGVWAEDPTSTIRARQATAKGADEHYFVVGLGSGVSEASLRDMSCKTGAIYTHADDFEEEQLQRAMISFYKYYALFKSINKVEGYSWTEPYESIPSIWGPMTTVVAPVYDKSREPWHMMGVAGVDATVCDLLASKVPEPAAGVRKTQRGCTCEESWTYNGNGYSGCTNVDWPVAWCATKGSCGSCDTPSVSGGCWDDCEPEGKEGVLQNELLTRATAWCEPAALDTCALQALHVSAGEPMCTTSQPGFDYASCTDLKIEEYLWAIDGPQDPGSTSYALKAEKASLLGTVYDMNADTCTCDDTMQPACACAAAAEPSPPPHNQSSSSSPTVAAVGSLVGIIILFPSTTFSILAICFKPYLRKKLLQYGWRRTADFFVPNVRGDLRKISVKVAELEAFLAKQKLPRIKDVTPEIDPSDMTHREKDVLGRGGYGYVLKGTFKGEPVAIKAMFGNDTNRVPASATKMMRREAMILCSLNHPNILKIHGVVSERGWIVMELCEGGALDEVLRDPEIILDHSTRLRIAAETATGIAYLHLSDVSIVHGDMKAGNVLLTKDLSVRICDFGMSEAKNRSKTMTVEASSSGTEGIALTVAWSAPELFKDRPKSFATDMYALGLTLWEIYERRVPFGNMPEAAVVNQVLSGIRPEMASTEMPDEIRKLIQLCWSEEPRERPAADKMAFILTRLSVENS